MKYGATALLLVAAFLVPAYDCVAYPIPPRSLRQLYHDADLVVVAHVQNTESVEHADIWQNAKATLHVTSRLKGDSQDVVAVYYSAKGYREAIQREPKDGYEQGRETEGIAVRLLDEVP